MMKYKMIEKKVVVHKLGVLQGNMNLKLPENLQLMMHPF